MKDFTKNFKYLYFSQLFANTSDNIYILALVAYIYIETHSIQLSALVPIFITTAYFLSGIIAPNIYSKFKKQHILINNQSMKCCLLLLLFISMYYNVTIIVILIVAFMIAFLDGFTNPLSNTLIPYFETKDNIIHANTKISAMNNMIQISAWAAGGILLGLIGSHYLILMCTVISIISMWFILKIDFRVNTVDKSTNGSANIKEAIKVNLRVPYSRFLNLNTFISSFGHSVWIAAIMIAFVKEILNVEENWFGFLNASFFIGLLLGTRLIQNVMNIKVYRLYLIGYIVLAVITFLFGINRWITIALILSLLFGVTEQILSIKLHSDIQEKLAHDELIDTYTFNSMIYSFGFCISTFLMSTVADHYSIQSVFYIATLSYLLIFVFVINYRRIF